MMSKYLFHPYSIKHDGQHYRFLTHAFIHGDYIHLAFNCLALVSFGSKLEKYLSNADVFNPQIGKLYYILLFTGGIYAASITEYYRHKNNPTYSSLGASGAISAIIFACILVFPTDYISLFFIRLPGWIAGTLLIAVSYVLIRRKREGMHSDNISHEAHFWGAIYGIMFMLLIKPSLAKYFLAQIVAVFS
jgi:membrane associated rhomboid family serine protease